MPERSLWTNVVLPPSNDAPPNTTYSSGTGFTVTADTVAIALRWYQINASAPPVTRLRLYRVIDQQLLGDINPAPDNNAVGWQRSELSVPVALETGVDYRVVGDLPTNHQMAYKTAATLPVPDNPLAFDQPYRSGTANGFYGFPQTSSGNDFAHMFDVIVDSDAEAPTGEFALDMENALARWLSADDDNTRQQHLPWLTHVLGQDIKAIAESNELALASIGPAVVGAGGVTALTRLGQILTAIEGATGIAANLQAVYDAIVGGAALSDIETIVSNHYNLSLLQSGKANIPHHQPGWTLQDTLVGQGSHQWVQPADTYEFVMTNAVASLRMQTQVGIGSILMWRGWAKPWDGTFWYPEHVQVNGPDCVIRSGGRWPGVGLWVPPDVEWELKAYIYTGS